MALTSQQRAALEAAAKERGIDPAKLIAEAEAMSGSDETSAKESEPSSAEPPKLFMYLLPFVRVREVRKIWLKLEESFPGDDAVAAEWAAKFGGGSGSDEPPPEAA